MLNHNNLPQIYNGISFDWRFNRFQATLILISLSGFLHFDADKTGIEKFQQTTDSKHGLPVCANLLQDGTNAPMAQGVNKQIYLVLS